MSPEAFTNLIQQTSMLLFDLDGTLVNSTGSVKRAWRDFAARHQVDEADIFAISEGRQGHSVIAELRPDLDPHEEDRKLIHFQVTDADDVIEVAGAKRLLERLDSSKWVIVTSCTRALATARLNAAGLPHPQLLITADDTLRSKPDPEGFQLAMEKLGRTPDECVIFEDSPAGIEAANRAGVRVIRVGQGPATNSPEYQSGELHSISDWSLLL